jgi:excisionase family DNA binding protein
MNIATPPRDRTFMPPGGDLITQIEAFLSQHSHSGTKLVSADGQTVELPDEFFDILAHVATAMQQGLAVSVAPVHQTLSTQEAADLLGISRTTLVRLLESGEIPFTQPSRHRKVALVDLLEYRNRQRQRAEQALTDLVADAERLGFYDVAEGKAVRHTVAARRRAARS